MSEGAMYRFTFDKPVKFKRAYNFLPLFASANMVWLPQESSESYIASTKLKTKTILVKILKISPKFIWEEQYYNITLIGDTTDNFIIQKDNIAKFLELFGLE